MANNPEIKAVLHQMSKQLDSLIQDLIKGGNPSGTIAKAKSVQKKTKQIEKQLRERYTYLVGKWAGSTRAKSTRTGKFVKRQEVIDSLDTKKPLKSA